ncbi:MAG: DUF1801 domain-containing protein [Marinibacterium sp.]|nr:DUF1801 domain-containing protein [Marinibacterium sp.]
MQMTGGDVDAFLNALEPGRRAREAQVLDVVFRAATGFAPRLWEDGMVGYGRCTRGDLTGQGGDGPATGFASCPRALSIHILPGYGAFGDLLAELGRHKLGRSCLYIQRLDDVDLDILGRLIRAGLKRLNGISPVAPT